MRTTGRHSGSRRSTGRRTAHAARRTTASCQRQQSRFSAHRSQGWWKWYYSPRQVAKRKRATAAARRKKQAAVRRAKHRGQKPFPKLTAAQWNAYWRSKCPKPGKPARKTGHRIAGKALVIKPARAARGAKAAGGLPAARPAHATRARPGRRKRRR